MVVISELLSKPDLSAADLNKLKLVDLKKICKEKGLGIAGTKSELITRFLHSLNPNADSTVSDVTDAVEEELLGSPETNESMIEVTESKTSEAGLNDEASEFLEKKQKFTKIEAPPSKDSLDQKKLMDRMKRFGAVSEENKKMARAARFQSGTVVDTTACGDDILKKRAERFNQGSEVPVSDLTSSDDAIKKRIARFGDVQQQPTSADSTSVLSKKRPQFGEDVPSMTDDAKVKRAKRFGLN